MNSDTPTHRYCSTKSPKWQEFRRKFDAAFYSNAESMDTDDTIYIDTRYVVLYNNQEQKVPIERVQASHKALNIAFSAQNTDELAKVPDNELYPWKPLIGNPNIRFLPLNENELGVEYQQISSTSLNNTSPVSDAANRANVRKGVMNIYIGNTTRGILGQAELSSNIVFALHSAIGHGEYPGTLTNYDLSKTLVHELGHALSLPHTFSDDVCDHKKVFPDVPEQVNPNFNTVLTQDSDGSPNCRGDHRYNDRQNNQGKSCLSIQSDVNTTPNEMGINYMDYGVDHVSLMFTKSQALMMRMYLKSDDNTTVELRTVDYQSLSSIANDNVPDDGVINISSDDDEGDGVFTNQSDSMTALSIALIVIVSIIVLAILVGMIVYYYKHNHSFNLGHHTTRYMNDT